VYIFEYFHPKLINNLCYKTFFFTAMLCGNLCGDLMVKAGFEVTDKNPIFAKIKYWLHYTI